MSIDRYNPGGELITALQQTTTADVQLLRERRDPRNSRPWHVHEVSSRVGMYLAHNHLTGRSFRLPVVDRDQAEMQVAMLNRTVVELRA